MKNIEFEIYADRYNIIIYYDYIRKYSIINSQAINIIHNRVEPFNKLHVHYNTITIILFIIQKLINRSNKF